MPSRAQTAAWRGNALLGAFLIGWSLPLSGYSATAGSHPPISPNQAFSTPLLDLRAPPSTGWYGLAQSANVIAFAKSGSHPHESFVAAVSLFRLPGSLKAAALAEYVREGIIKDSPSDRFEVIESDVRDSTDRKYPCVSYHGVSYDRKAQSWLPAKKLRIEVIALYCEYPDRSGLAFSVSFSHRGGTAADGIAQEAAVFIDSVQVPKKAN